MGDGSSEFQTLWGRPFLAMPQIASGALVLGSFGGYGLLERGSIRVETSREEKFSTDQTAFRFVWRGDGAVQNAARFIKSSGITSPGT